LPGVFLRDFLKQIRPVAGVPNECERHLRVRFICASKVVCAEGHKSRAERQMYLHYERAYILSGSRDLKA
jgi:hypothetical protein